MSRVRARPSTSSSPSRKAGSRHAGGPRRRGGSPARALLVAGLALNAAGALMLVALDWESPLRLVLIWVGVLLICAAAYNR